MNNPDTRSGDWAASTAKNTVLLGYWTGAWVVTQALAKFGPLYIWESNTLLTGLAIFINLAVGFVMIMANKRHLEGLDEMQRKIQLDAMALSLGVGLVAGLGYANLASFIPFKAEISHMIILMGLIYLVGIFAGVRRYK
ncbi:MAG: hypothetical protein WBS20_08620 [Lysobacterales bacterium]